LQLIFITITDTTLFALDSPHCYCDRNVLWSIWHICRDLKRNRDSIF